MSARVAARRWSLGVRLIVIALVWSAGLIIVALFIPTYASDRASEIDGVTLTSSTLLQSKSAERINLCTNLAVRGFPRMTFIRNIILAASAGFSFAKELAGQGYKETRKTARTLHRIPANGRS